MSRLPIPHIINTIKTKLGFDRAMTASGEDVVDAVNKQSQQIDDLQELAGNTALPTTAQTLTGAVDELESEKENKPTRQDFSPVNKTYGQIMAEIGAVVVQNYDNVSIEKCALNIAGRIYILMFLSRVECQFAFFTVGTNVYNRSLSYNTTDGGKAFLATNNSVTILTNELIGNNETCYLIM